MAFSRPGTPTDNAFLESFNGRLRDECLNCHWFESLADAKLRIRAWSEDYYASRPHKALNGLSPNEFTASWVKIAGFYFDSGPNTGCPSIYVYLIELAVLIRGEGQYDPKEMVTVHLAERYRSNPS